VFPRAFVYLLGLCAALCSCHKAAPDAATGGAAVLRVGASAVPHAPILRAAAEVLARDNVRLQIITFNDYVQPNMRLAEGDLDANYYQTQAYLELFNTQHHLALTSMGPVHLEPFGLYSRKHRSLHDLPDNAWVAIPNERSNGHRALALLVQAGVITLDPKQGLMAGVKDIQSNPKHLRFKEVEAAMIPRLLDDVDVAGINTNFALGAHLVPRTDALMLESADAPYANVLVVRSGETDRPELKRLMQALHSDEVAQFIAQSYGGAVLSARGTQAAAP
jgi:D-methionine transport system substrate-binding protein